ncbi:MAG: DNA polymerase III subunit delta [Erysipelotrichales bacterium]|nr:DNA polymerase III subunit delta [Erysipelotrichales bacterium]
MICLIFGAQDLMIKNRLNKLLNERLGSVDDFNCVKFNADNVEIEDVMFECTMMPLGSEKKAVVLDNANFLSGEKTNKKQLTKEQEKSILSYLSSSNEYCDLYFIVHSSTLNESNAIYKKIKEVGKIVESVNPNEKEWMAYVYKLFEKYEITASNDVISEFIKRTNNDAMRINNEVKKLALYGDKITMDALDLLVARPIDDNIFDLVNFIMANKKEEAIKLYRDLIIKNEEPVALIALISTQLRFYIDVFTLAEEKMYQDDIAKQLKAHPYRVKLALNNKRYVSLKSLKDNMENLYKLDYDIKSGRIDRFFGLELFILNFNR